MNKLLLSLLLAVITASVSAQRVYFIYLQTEQEQPFFARMNDKIYSSSASGYLILPKLQDGTYDIAIGFPAAKWPEQKFAITVRAKDQGFLLKNFDTNGWGLFNLQTLAVQMAAQPDPLRQTAKPEIKEASPFTNLLAKAADDSTLKEKPLVAKVEEKKPEVKITTPDTIVAKKEEPKTEIKEPEIIKPAVVVEPVTAKTPVKPEIKEQVPAKTEETKPAVKEAVANLPIEPPAVPAQETTEYIRSVVTRRSESSTSEGFGLTFIDQHNNGMKDTITIFIPNAKPLAVATRDVSKEEKKFLDITSDTTTAKPVTQVQPDIKKEEPATEIKQAVAVDTVAAPKPVVLSNGCKEVAAEADFLKLRKGMAAVETEEDMLDEARKYFRTKCFTTLQVKNLGALFLSDAGKYKFFDLAYGYVSDADKFGSLQSELKEEYYINRFKAMLK